MDFKRDTGNAGPHIQILLRILKRDHGEAVIELAAQLQNPDDMQTHAFGLEQLMVGIRIGDHDGHPVALFHVQRIGDAFTDNDLLLARFEMIPGVILHK
ncbi:Uncharacterised protein [Salmonella enterica subsp. enterica serovar Typhi]|nr:Uncharacterised protein [Salmonella enterica subsp. enterica serovar Typhi]CGA11958.1 Uncharacterised protein [Salmonella enterica subsp. enterica serovar Typhi]CHC45224.1 Uncharacterised protein [Salmonella enterica subsp. enterica serovar Typhi]CHE74029.1 Uncharacterised protein [Salmonella enterica subsp. enterica serovar Typhi]CHI27719.1 Uncharacterised protein [Salmonella enterica subsp. enterica serovar Typhi]